MIRTKYRAPHRAAVQIFLAAVFGGFLACTPTTTAEEAPANDTAENDMLAHPGTEPYPDELRDRLWQAYVNRGEGYEPRTHHFQGDGRPKYVNRLILEDSPYLLQHAHNPVNWYSWGPEAFARAKAEDKPIFLSIGYSTCHWCHVMERESFEDEGIAKILNEKFIAIKIDRERRPDIDELYMTAVYLTSGSGGWPMSSFLTPEAKPIFGGTYFPPAHFRQLLGRVDEAWTTDREAVLESADRLAEAVADITAARGEAQEVGAEALDQAVATLLAQHDAEYGGFGGAPKFPQEPQLLFLLARDRHLSSRDTASPDPKREDVAAALDKTLDAMARGGIYDQVGGGFHRYSTDPKWLVPHFEKMLYNQAHLARAYLGGYELLGRDFYARVARQTLDYVLREMTSPEGGFYSATDADSEGEEGTFFLWTPETLRVALEEKDAELVIELFGVTEAGNFEGKNILHLPVGLAEFAASKEMKLDDLLERVDRIRETLWQAREKREHPLRDDKILTAWNGMMITTLAEGAEVLDQEGYLDAALRAAELLWTKNRREDGRLWRLRLGDTSSTLAKQEDFAYLGEAFLALYDATGEAKWLERARALVDTMNELFWDDEHGGYFMSAAADDPHLIARPKSPGDGAIPSGNSVAMQSLALLAARTDEPAYEKRANELLAAFSSGVAKSPSGFAYLLRAFDALGNGEVGARQYAAHGTVRADARLDAAGELTVTLDVADGWHVNAHEPLQENLIATDLEAGEGATLADVVYPEPETVELGFQDEPLAVYEGSVTLRGKLSGAGPILPVHLRVQACDDEVCLRPETVVLEVSNARMTSKF